MTDITTSPALADAVDTHLQAYCEQDATRRLHLLEAVWATDGVLIDPPFDGAGIDAIAALADAVLEHYPEHRFVRTTDVDAHHRSARYGWALVSPQGDTAVTGTDIVDTDPDGKFVRILGFFGDPTTDTIGS